MRNHRTVRSTQLCSFLFAFTLVVGLAGCGKEKESVKTTNVKTRNEDYEKLSSTLGREEMAMRALDELMRFRLSAAVLINKPAQKLERRCIKGAVSEKGYQLDYRCAWKASRFGGKESWDWSLAGVESFLFTGEASSKAQLEFIVSPSQNAARAMKLSYRRMLRVLPPEASSAKTRTEGASWLGRLGRSAAADRTLMASIFNGAWVAQSSGSVDLASGSEIKLQYVSPVKGSEGKRTEIRLISRGDAKVASGDCPRIYGEFLWLTFADDKPQAQGSLVADANGIQADGGPKVAWPKGTCLEF